MGRRGRANFLGIVAALATILGSHAALGQSGGSVPDGAGLRDTLTGARHPGLRGWRVTTIQGGDSVMQRNTLLPPAQIACGFSSAKMTSRGAQEQACARETSPQTLAEATGADGRKGGLCVAPRPMQGGYALRYNAQFPGAGSDTVVTCIVVANGVQFTQFGLAQHERDVRAFLTGVTIPGEAPAPPPVVASRPGATASGAPAAANSDAGRLAELALTFGAKGPLRQLTLQAARAHLPMVNWTKASAASEEMGEYLPARVEGLLSGLNTTIEGDMVWFYADYGGKKLPPKAALLTSLVGQGATVRRHGCLQESNGAGRSFHLYRHEAVAVTPPTGRPFLAFVGTTQNGQNAEEVGELRFMLETPFPPMRELFFGNGDPPTRPCPAWAPVTAVAPSSSATSAVPAATDVVPPAVLSDIAPGGDYDRECRRGGGRPMFRTEGAERADLTGDGVRDWVVSTTLYQCQGGPPMASWFGRGETWLIFDGANMSANAAPLFSQQVVELILSKVGGRDVATVSVGGGWCRASPGDRSTICKRQLIYNSRQRSLEMGPIVER